MWPLLLQCALWTEERMLSVGIVGAVSPRIWLHIVPLYSTLWGKSKSDDRFVCFVFKSNLTVTEVLFHSNCNVMIRSENKVSLFGDLLITRRQKNLICPPQYCTQQCCNLTQNNIFDFQIKEQLCFVRPNRWFSLMTCDSLFLFNFLHLVIG